MARSSDSQIDLLAEIERSMPSSAEHPVRGTQSQAGAAVVLTSATSQASMRDWLRRFALGGSSGRTSPEFCPWKEDGPSGASSGSFANSGMASHGECWMLNSSEWPSDASVCFLSEVLEAPPLPERFFLSPRACAGILRRAGKRGKRLPERLAEALRATALPMTSTE